MPERAKRPSPERPSRATAAMKTGTRMPSMPLLELQRTAGNRAVTEWLGMPAIQRLIKKPQTQGEFVTRISDGAIFKVTKQVGTGADPIRVQNIDDEEYVDISEAQLKDYDPVELREPQFSPEESGAELGAGSPLMAAAGVAAVQSAIPVIIAARRMLAKAPGAITDRKNTRAFKNLVSGLVQVAAIAAPIPGTGVAVGISSVVHHTAHATASTAIATGANQAKNFVGSSVGGAIAGEAGPRAKSPDLQSIKESVSLKGKAKQVARRIATKEGIAKLLAQPVVDLYKAADLVTKSKEDWNKGKNLAADGFEHLIEVIDAYIADIDGAVSDADDVSAEVRGSWNLLKAKSRNFGEVVDKWDKEKNSFRAVLDDWRKKPTHADAEALLKGGGRASDYEGGDED